MSATRTPSRPGALDAFYTPDDVAAACVRTLGGLRGLSVLEPHAGGGAFVRAATAAGAASVWAMDINPQAPALAPGACPNRMCGDFLREAPIGPGGAWGGEPPDWILGNPPFNEAEAHVRRALSLARHGVGFLLRLAFLEGLERAEFWREHRPSEVYVFRTRPSFRELYEDGTVGRLRKRDRDTGEVVTKGGKPVLVGCDSCAYGWFVWRLGVTHEPVLRWLDWRAQ